MRASVRRQVILLLVKTILLLLLAAGLTAGLVRVRPAFLRSRFSSALEAGRVERARSIASRFSEEEAAALLRQCSYRDALSAAEQGEYERALVLFEEAGEFSDAREQKSLCLYRLAEEAEENGEFERAEELFSSLQAYRDAHERASDCLIERSARLRADGDPIGAAKLLETLAGNERADSLLLSIAEELTGLKGDAALAAFRGIGPEEMAHRLRLREHRARLPQNILDVGFYHTVGLSADGRVLACGDDRFGQCDTGAWKNAVSVSAGAYHTLALLRDGSVVAAGRNTEGQCEVGAWRDVIAIAASDYASYALTKSGTLLAAGLGDHSEPESWSSLRSVAAGSYAVSAVGEDGSVWFYPMPVGVDALRAPVSVALNTGYAAALQEDGHVFCSAVELSAWEDAVALSASGTAILALTEGGTLLSHFFREEDRVDFSSVTDAVAVAAGGTHFAVALSDGSVRVFGSPQYGEDRTQGWHLAAG